ncbi:MAG: hypothetical protein CVU30_13210 [Betaproteobacteria bacterium HGW-Betaproteobacteria-3]|jgi:hypothetical protein|nr:MAG: hypothetical protein CVU30_13210 [Betaproteobacteria bacterium HGW-Betaproteobacteria-3]
MQAKSPSSHRRVIANFETCSVALITAFVIGTAPFARAQGTTPAAPSTPSTQSSSSDAESSAAFARADKNKDGKLSPEEAQTLPAVAQRFEQIDTDGDKFISRAEFDKAVKP